MSNTAAVITADYFESKGLKFILGGEDDNQITTYFEMKNKDQIRIDILFDESEDSVAIRGFGVAKFPEARTGDMFVLVNVLNTQFRWIKFVVNPDTCMINAEDDAVIQMDSCGAEILELCMNMVAIVDEAYPFIMKTCFK